MASLAPDQARSQPHLQSWCVNDLIPIWLAEARLQATDDFRFEAPLGNGSFLSQPTMKLLRQPKADHPMSRPPLRQGKASDGCSKHQANDQSGNGGNGDGHGDTPSIRNSTIMLMATVRTGRRTTHPRRHP